jgi:uncharacterized protein YciI
LMTMTPQFLYCIRPARPMMLVEGATEYEAAVVAQHFRYLQELVDTGAVLLAGRTLNNDDKAFGVMRNDPV